LVAGRRKDSDTRRRYINRVLFRNHDGAINIKADKVNLGLKKLWFYDAEKLRNVRTKLRTQPVGPR
jgi:hypothetical protein